MSAIAQTLFDVRPPRRERQAATLVEQILSTGFPRPELEFVFAACIGRNWRFDIAWPQQRLAVEVEGAMFGRVINVAQGFEYRRVRGEKVHVPIEAGTIFRLGGRHNAGAGLNADLEKRAWAAILGWCVISASTAMVRDDQVLPLLAHAFQQRGVTIRLPEKAEVGF